MPSSSRIFAASFITSRSLELPIRMPTSGWAAFVRAAFAAGFAAGFGAFAAAFAEGFAAFAVMRFSLLFGARAGRVRCLALALFALDCAPRDVAAAVRSVPVNAIDGGVCRGRCIRNALAGRAHAEHTASGRDPMTRRIALGAGVKDLCTGRSRGIVDTDDPFFHSRRWLASVRSIVASTRSSRLESRRIISAWHSGSPKRTLYSSTFGPDAVSMMPAYRTPR